MAIIWTWYKLLFMIADCHHTRFVPFDLNLGATALTHETHHENRPIVGADGKLIPLFIQIIAIYVSPILSSHGDAALHDIPHAQ